MEIPVTLVPSIDAQAWPNEIYVGYATGWMRRYDQEFDPDRSTSGRLPPTGRKNPAPQMATTPRRNGRNAIHCGQPTRSPTATRSPSQ